MAEIWMDVDTALSEVPVNIMPLIDDTDFKTREVEVAYNQAGMNLVWNFVTTGGGMTQTAVTPTTGGTYDWAHQGGGMYSIEVPATGGASINNDTEGFGWFTGYATGVLPWRGPIIGFRAAGINNVLIDSAYSTTRGLAGTALPDAAADAAGGLPISDAGGLDLDAQIGTDIDAILVDTGTTLDGKLDTIDGIVDNILVDTGTTIPGTITTIDNEIAVIDGIVDSILVDTGTTIPAQLTSMSGATFDTGTDSLEAIRNRGDAAWVTGAGSSAPTVEQIRAEIDSNSTQLAAIVEDTGTTIPAALTTIDNEIAVIDGIVDSILVDTAVIGAAGAGLTAVPWNAAWDAEVQSECADALTAYDPPTNTELEARTLVAANYATAANQTSIEGKVDTIDGIVDSILEDTGTSIPATLATIDSIVDAILVDTGTTLPAALFDPASDTVNIGRINSITIDGSGTEIDPWGPA